MLTKNLHFAKATFPGFSATEAGNLEKLKVSAAGFRGNKKIEPRKTRKNA
jgi:hypothetical protein